MIKIKNLNKSFGKTVIFSDASFSFPDKGLICVLGPSGCGKSTLLNMLAGFDSEYSGEISVHGEVLSQMSEKELCAYRRDNVGFVFQNYHLLSGYTSLENVTLSSVANEKEQSESRALSLLDKLGLSEKAAKKIETLSGGQKQRVAIARALFSEPSVLLCDEPTGALDRKNSSEIMELLKELSKDRLVIVITHDKKCAEYAEQIVTLSEGKLMSEGEETAFEEKAKLIKKDAPKVSSLKRAAKNFKVRFSRSLAVALAISIGVLCVTLSLSSGNIMEQSIADFKEKNTALQSGYIKTDGNEEEVLQILKADSRVDNAYSQYMLKDVSVTLDGKTVLLAEEYPTAKAKEQMSYGVMPRNGENELALSPSLASKLGSDIGSLIGKEAEISLDGQKYKVKISGIFNSTYDDIFLSSDIERELCKNIGGKAYSVSYDVLSFNDVIPVSESLQKTGIESKTAADEVKNFLDTFKNLNRLFLTVSILIFAVSIFISAILLVKQQNTRYHEIGLLSALGYEKGFIQKMMFCENLLLSLLSAALSAVLTAIVFFAGKSFGFPIEASFVQILTAFVLTAALILIIGVLSSIKLISAEPAEALRK